MVRFVFALYFMALVGVTLFSVEIGILLPVLWRKVNSVKKILIIGFAVSLAIELLQLLEGSLKIAFLRIVDINDLILNTLGAGFGYIIYMLMNLVITKYRIKTAKELS